MRKYLLKLAFIALLFPVFLPAGAQDFDVKIKADTVLVPGSSATVELTVLGGSSPYSYMLYDNEPWEGGKLLDNASDLYQSSHSFTITNAGSYFIAVRDANKLTKFIYLRVKLANSASLYRNSSHNLNQPSI
jgi:hypothetical protein